MSAGLSPRLLPKRNGVICDVPATARGLDHRAARRPGRAAAAGQQGRLLPLHRRQRLPRLRSRRPHHDPARRRSRAAQLADRGELPGTVRLLFQPSEEATPSGAPEVIAAGGLTDVSAIFALHCAPAPSRSGSSGCGPARSPRPRTWSRSGCIGAGGHTARPHLTADLVHALGRVIVDVPSLLRPPARPARRRLDGVRGGARGRGGERDPESKGSRGPRCAFSAARCGERFRSW